MRSTSLAATLFLVMATHPTVAGEVDPALPDYTPTDGLSASLVATGSDTLFNMVIFWAEEFQTLQPQLRITVEGKGSSTAWYGLMHGADLGMAARLFTEKEVASFRDKFGCPPTAIAVAMDALAVIVHPYANRQVQRSSPPRSNRSGVRSDTWVLVMLTPAFASYPWCQPMVAHRFHPMPTPSAQAPTRSDAICTCTSTRNPARETNRCGRS